MRKSSKKHQRGCIKSERKPISTKNGPDTSSLRQRLLATCNAPTVQEKKTTPTWTSTCSKESLMRQRCMALAHSLSICSENLSSILKYGKLSSTSKKLIIEMLCSLRLTALCSTDLLESLLNPEWTSSSGAGDPKPSSPKKRKRG